MATDHGINVTEQDTSLTTPQVAESGVPFVIGTAPVHAAASPAAVGVPVLCTSWTEAVERLGYYDSDWDKYTLCEFMYSHFQLYGCQPVVFVNLLDPDTMNSDVAEASFTVSNHRATLPGEARNTTALVVKNGSTTLTDGTDYEAFYSDGKLIVELLAAGTAYSATTLKIAYSAVTPSSVTASAVAAAVEKIELCLTTIGTVPDMILAPGFSHDAAVAAAMAAKAASITGMFRAIAIVDLDSTSDGATSYDTAVAKKNSNALTDDFQVVCWPMAKLSDRLFHMSTQLAGSMCAIDTDNEGVPYESPENKTLKIDSLCLADGTTEVQLTKTQADILVAGGIETSINFINGWVAWGSHMACYPGNTDVKDYFLPNRRMFNWVGNTLITSFWSQIGEPMTTRLVDTIINSAEIWLSGLVASEYLLGARIVYNDDENPVTSLAAGKVKLHIYLTPPGPLEELDFVLEYDADYLTSAFSES